eukprot:Sspe_Gene.83907::Locus_55053_Transcript_1_1_Confidence_1.000_Length_560::g.83907::m.83907
MNNACLGGLQKALRTRQLREAATIYSTLQNRDDEECGYKLVAAACAGWLSYAIKSHRPDFSAAIHRLTYLQKHCPGRMAAASEVPLALAHVMHNNPRNKEFWKAVREAKRSNTAPLHPVVHNLWHIEAVSHDSLLT